MHHYTRSRGAQPQAGFTIIELIVVLLIIGILIAIVAPRITGAASTSGRAQALWSFADNVKNNTIMLDQQLSLQPVVNANPAVVAGNSWLDLLFAGDPYIIAADQSAYDNSGVGTLEGSMNATTAPKAGTPGVYTVQDFPVTVVDDDGTAGAKNAVVPAPSVDIAYAGVPWETAAALVAAHDPTCTPAPTSAAGCTGNVIIVGTPSASGTTTVTATVSIR